MWSFLTSPESPIDLDRSAAVLWIQAAQDPPKEGHSAVGALEKTLLTDAVSVCVQSLGDDLSMTPRVGRNKHQAAEWLEGLNLQIPDLLQPYVP